MGITTENVVIFTADITLDAHTATHAEHLRPISLADFAEAQPLALQRVRETRELICTRMDGAFIQGPETAPDDKFITGE